MGIANDLTALKTASDTLTNNKVSRFAYTEQAYTDNDANGVLVYDVNNDQNIPVGTATVMKVNQTVIEKGWRARASSITRMLMNHFLGRISYNLNKVNDWFNSLLGSLSASLGTANGIATLDENGHLAQQSPVGSPYVPVTKSFLYAIFGKMAGQVWESCTGVSSDYRIQTIVYANGMFVAGSNNSTPYGNIFWSENGKDWTQGIGMPSVDTDVHIITYQNNLWLCAVYDVVASTDVNGIYWSEDGKYWTRCTGLPSNYNNTITGIVYANNIWVCSIRFSGLWWSTDGKAWTQGTGSVPSNENITNLTYANGIWHCAVQNNNGAWWSEDGKAWTQCTGITGVNAGAFTYAYGLWLCAFYQSGVYWSEDGKDWTACTSTYSAFATLTLNKFFYEGGLLIGGGNSNAGAWYSKDGKSWRPCGNIANTTLVSNITYANGLWVANCRSEGIWYSTSGTNWAQGISANITSSYPVVYVNGLWILANFISEDGMTWKRIDAKAGSIDAVAYSSGTWVYGGYSSNPSDAGNKLTYTTLDTIFENKWIDIGDTPIVEG